MKAYQLCNVHVRHTVPVGHAERLLAFQMTTHLLETAARTRPLSCFYERHIPWLGGFVVHFHAVVRHVKGHVGGVQKVVGKILLDDVAPVAQTNDEIVDAVLRVHLQYVPENRPAANFDHGLGTHRRLFTDTSSQPTCQDHCLHFHPTLWRPLRL